MTNFSLLQKSFLSTCLLYSCSSSYRLEAFFTQLNNNRSSGSKSNKSYPTPHTLFLSISIHLSTSLHFNPLECEPTSSLKSNATQQSKVSSCSSSSSFCPSPPHALALQLVSLLVRFPELDSVSKLSLNSEHTTHVYARTKQHSDSTLLAVLLLLRLAVANVQKRFILTLPFKLVFSQKKSQSFGI